MKSIEEKAMAWNHGKSIESRSRHYTTGEVAEILGIKGSRQAARRQVAQLIDGGTLKGRHINGRDGSASRSYRVVSHSCLVKYIEEHGGIRARKWLLARKTEEFYELLSQEREILSGLGGLEAAIRKVVKNLDPIDEMTGASADMRRIEVLKKLTELMDRHIKLRVLIAKHKAKK